MDIDNKIVVTSGEREVGRGDIGVWKKGVIMGLYEILCETFEYCKAQ